MSGAQVQFLSSGEGKCTHPIKKARADMAGAAGLVVCGASLGAQAANLRGMKQASAAARLRPLPPGSIAALIAMNPTQRPHHYPQRHPGSGFHVRRLGG